MRQHQSLPPCFPFAKPSLLRYLNRPRPVAPAEESKLTIAADHVLAFGIQAVAYPRIGSAGGLEGLEYVECLVDVQQDQELLTDEVVYERAVEGLHSAGSLDRCMDCNSTSLYARIKCGTSKAVSSLQREASVKGTAVAIVG